ncbi:cytochrome P450 [Schizopora paradoxa]|uniref:Cytochrome P450 n=1 Tax=Schizopora paradoxa TaxID=27342 RepID=A0A0H2RZE3_9AGAM|nr:cytochrome P450 [Schizopora paradoxa]
MRDSPTQVPSENRIEPLIRRGRVPHPLQHRLFASAMANLSLTLIDCAILTIILLWLGHLHRRNTAKVPPGPKGYPVIGNVFDMMASEIWAVRQEWERTYGDLVYLISFGQPIVIINSYRTAVELLEKRSLNYSDRPGSVMMNELQRWDWIITTKSYGDDLRSLRDPMQKFFEANNLPMFDHILNHEAEKLVRGLLHAPNDCELQLRTAIASSIMMLMYGHEVTSSEDPFVALARNAVKEIILAIRQGTYLVDILPWLKYVPKWFPGAGFKLIAERGAKLSYDVQHLPYLRAKDKIFSGKSSVRSFTEHEIERCLEIDGELSKLDEYRISAMGGNGYLAGADTSFSSLSSFLLAMALFPEVQKRAQAEIDQVVGNDRLPKLSDRQHLPYCTALSKEIYRWNPVNPGGIPHMSNKDDIYNGYLIPAKTVIIPNHWAMLYDPEEYPNPEVFRPERFIPTSGKRMERDPTKVAFGFGRRVCPGRFAAENMVFRS